MIRELSFVAISLCILYFTVGYGITFLGDLRISTFNSYATLIAGVASVVGLISLVRPSITQTDIQDLEVGALKSISQAAKDLEKVKGKNFYRTRIT